MHFVTKNSQFVNCVPNKICHFSLFCINLVNFTELLHCFTELFSNQLGKNAEEREKNRAPKKGALFWEVMTVGQNEWFPRL